MHHTHTQYSSQRQIFSQTSPEQCVQKNPTSFIRQFTFYCVAIALMLSGTYTAAVANERLITDGSSYQRDTPNGGTLMLHNANGNVEAILLDANMKVSVSGLIAQMSLTQTFENSSSQWMQARYLFPLPETAAVQSLLVKTGGRTIHGRIMTRREARDTFETAKDNGQIAGLVEQQRPNLFTMDIASIAPNSELSVTVTVMLPVDVDRTSRSINLPTTHTPRYSNNQTSDSANVTGEFATNTQVRGPRLDLTLSIEGMEQYNTVSSDTHVLSFGDDLVTMHNVPMDRDVVIRWPAAYSNRASSEIYISEHDNERYAQLLLNPPAQLDAQTYTPREVVLVVDKSGSMAGESIQAARKALAFAIDSLRPEDEFNIIAFNDQSDPLFNQSRPATEANLRKAMRFVTRLEADGGTEMWESLRMALRTPGQTSKDFNSKYHRGDDAEETSSDKNNELEEIYPASSKNKLRQIVFITDGSVGYEEDMLLEIKQHVGDSRLFTIGIGSAPNQWFLEKAAEAGRGISLSIPDSQSAANAINLLLGNMANPIVTDVSVQFMGGRGELYPNPIPDLYADKPQLLVSRLSPDVHEILVSGKQHFNGEIRHWQQQLTIEQLDTASAATEKTQVPVAKLFWTRLKVASLLDEQRYSADEELHKQTITQLGLNAQLLTPYTSFAAVEKKPVRPSDAAMYKTEVANLIPHGNRMMDLAMPQGSAGVDTLVWLSLILAMVGLLMITFASRSRQVIL